MFLALIAGTAMACGGGAEPSGSGGSGSTGATSGTSTSAAGGGSTGTGGGAQTLCGGALTIAPGSEFCGGGSVAVNCTFAESSDLTALCGVPLGAPAKDLARSTAVKKFFGNGPPDLGCFTPAGYPAKPGASTKVKMSGVARIFSHGCESKSLAIEITTVVRSGGDDDGSPGALVGAMVQTPASCQATGEQTPSSDCGTRYECPFLYDGVPTETELLIKTSGALWATTYEYNVYLPNSAVKNGMVSHDVQAFAADDLQAISAAAGQPGGSGMILGEVHDCADVRLLDAVVDVDRKKTGIAYFTANEANPLPDLSATATGPLGMFLALGLDPGPVAVGAAGNTGGVLSTVGFTRAQSFANAVSLVTFHGPLPSQIP